MIGIWLVAGGGVSLLLWSWVGLWRNEKALTFIPHTSWRVRWRDAFVRFLQRRWSAKILEESAVLGWTPATISFWALLFAAFVGLPTVIVTHNRLLALVFAGVGAWLGPQFWIHRNFVGWQQELMRDFVPLVLLLSVYFDLGLSPERAFEEALSAVGEQTAKQIRLLLAQWHQSNTSPAAIIQAWAAPFKLMPYQQLADVLAHHLDRGLSGAALKPLHTLITAQQQQGARAMADRVDQQVTVVPALVVLGLMIMVMFTFFAHGLGSTGGVTLL